MNLKGLPAILSFLIISQVAAYSQVNRNNEASGPGPQIFKALNMDLIFPKNFNATKEPSAPTPTQAPFLPTIPADLPDALPASTKNEPALVESTGRAVDYRPSYPFQQLIMPSHKILAGGPVFYRPPTKPKPQPAPIFSRFEADKLAGRGEAKDRFTPGEATASNLYKNKPSYSYNSNLNVGSGVIAPGASSSVDTYVPPKNLYSFPPNANANYPSSGELKPASSNKDAVSSYLPPASGPVADGNDFQGNSNADDAVSSYLPPASGPIGNGNDYDALGGQDFPPGNMDSMNGGGNNGDGGDSHVGEIAVGGGDDQRMAPEQSHDHPPPDHDDHPPQEDQSSHYNPHDHDQLPQPYEDERTYPTPPPGYVDDSSGAHHHTEVVLDHPPKPSFFDYSDLIYDHHPHHHHHHHPEPPPPPPPVMTEAPEPPPEPRVKKYSYFYIGRKLWYIPLYFTVWFSFYVLWLILKSIARHKVNLPNHYVSKREVPDWSHKEAKEKIDRLTAQVMDHIETFKDKYV